MEEIGDWMSDRVEDVTDWVGDQVEGASESVDDLAGGEWGQQLGQWGQDANEGLGEEPNFNETRDEYGNITITGTSDNDNLSVTPHYDGGLWGTGLFRNQDGVTVSDGDGESYDYLGDAANRLTIDGGDGDDQISVDPSLINHFNLRGGAGSDVLQGGAGNDDIDGGAGNDYVEGRDGDDRLAGGDGRDTIYGLHGDDTMSGGDGQDYLDGGQGRDFLSGDGGNDALMGGGGDDTIWGGSGEDVQAGGEGRDNYDGGAGADRNFRQADDTSDTDVQDTETNVDLAANRGSSVSVEGPEQFQDRVNSDLDAMRSLPWGQSVLGELDASGNDTRITQITQANEGNWASTDGIQWPWETGNESVVGYNPTRTNIGGAEDWMTRPPVVGLGHELLHSYNFTNGNVPEGKTDGVDNVEQIAVGIPIDHDGNPSTPRIQPNPQTENQLRDQLGQPPRPRY